MYHTDCMDRAQRLSKIQERLHRRAAPAPVAAVPANHIVLDDFSVLYTTPDGCVVNEHSCQSIVLSRQSTMEEDS